MIGDGIVIKICQVSDIYDETDGDRIKVRLSPEDDKVADKNIPYALPLLPKLMHIKPKVGEFVLILLTRASDGNSQRYYIGPNISQPQFMEDETYINRALSLYPGANKLPDVAPSTNKESHGALAGDKDVAIYGRKKSDIILTDNDVRVRCGARLYDQSEKGGLVFNRKDPAYIHLKHSDNNRGEDGSEYRSTATIVADKINLISHQTQTPFKTNDNNNLIADDEMQKIIDKAHQLPYGDILVQFLKMFVNAFALHSHPYPGMTPCETVEFNNVKNYDLEKILSQSVRIN
jgi:hypothetical protein